MTLGYTDGKTKLKITFIGMGILAICALTAFELRNLIRGPRVEIICNTEPCNKIVTDSNFYALVGKTSNISDIHIGERKIYTNKEGYFTTPITLYPGTNTIHIYAKDRFGKEVKKDISVYYTGTQTVSLLR
jgi:hypothetical protein